MFSYTSFVLSVIFVSMVSSNSIAEWDFGTIEPEFTTSNPLVVDDSPMITTLDPPNDDSSIAFTSTTTVTPPKSTNTEQNLIDSNTQHNNFLNLEDGQCGNRMVRRPKIINGSDAVHGHYPWMISLMINNRHHCGGSLINGNWILTAAHCVLHIEQEKFQVKLGSHFRNTMDEPTSVTVENLITIPHPGFSFATFAHDLALIRMPKSIKFSRYIQPVCLPNKITERIVPNKAMVIGWGKIRPGGFSAKALQEVEVPIVDNIKCLFWYREMGKMINIRYTQICAGFENGGKDACQGDSGSPLLVTQNKRAVIIGIVSAGIGCALPKLPGIYTRVSAYLPWIQETIEKYDRALNSEKSLNNAQQTTTVPPNTGLPTEITTSTINNKPDQSTDNDFVIGETSTTATNDDSDTTTTEWSPEISITTEDSDSNRPMIESEHDNLWAIITSSSMTSKNGNSVKHAM